MALDLTGRLAEVLRALLLPPLRVSPSGIPRSAVPWSVTRSAPGRPVRLPLGPQPFQQAASRRDQLHVPGRTGAPEQQPAGQFAATFPKVSSTTRFTSPSCCIRDAPPTGRSRVSVHAGGASTDQVRQQPRRHRPVPAGRPGPAEPSARPGYAQVRSPRRPAAQPCRCRPMPPRSATAMTGPGRVTHHRLVALIEQISDLGPLAVRHGQVGARAERMLGSGCFRAAPGRRKAHSAGRCPAVRGSCRLSSAVAALRAGKPHPEVPR